MIRRILFALFVAATVLPMIGCWHNRGSCRDTCNDRYYTPAQ